MGTLPANVGREQQRALRLEAIAPPTHAAHNNLRDQAFVGAGEYA